MSKSKLKTPRHAVGNLTAQPIPGASKSSLSKSYIKLDDLQPPGPLQSVKRRVLRGRRSVGSTEFKKGEDLHILELEEDTETPRGRIEAFLNNADTDSPPARSARPTPGPQNARSFTRTPSKLIKPPSDSKSIRVENWDLSLLSPGSAFSPRVNIERLLEGSGSEYSPLTRSLIAKGTKSDSKVPSSRRSRNWGQRVSASPMYNSIMRVAEEEARVSLGGSFRSLRQHRSFQIPELPGPDAGVKSLSQQTPSAERPKNLRLSKSDSKIRRASKTWGQRVSISPMNQSDVGEALHVGSASPGHVFKHPGHRRSFHIPEPPQTEEPELGPGDENGVSTVSQSNGQEQNEPQSDEEILAARLSKRGTEDLVLDSSAHVSKIETSLNSEMKDKMKIYDLSDGSSDSDFIPELFMNVKSQLASAEMNQTWSPDCTTPRSSRKLLSRNRPSGSSQYRAYQSEPKASHFSSGTHDSESASKRRRLDFGGGETATDLPAVEMSGAKSSPAGDTPVPPAPPSSTPLKREQRSRVRAAGEDTPTTVFSRHNRNDSEAIAVLSNETLSGLSPIRAVEEYGIADPVAVSTDALEDQSEDSELSPLVRSLVAMETRSDSKVASSCSSRILGQRVSASPVDVEDENRVSPAGSFGSLRQRKSSQLPEPSGPDVVDQSYVSSDIADKAEQEEAGDIGLEGSGSHNSQVGASSEGLDNLQAPEDDSPGGSSGMATPFIDITKKPPSLSTRKLNLITPFRKNKDKPAKGAKKAATSKRSANSQIGSRDCDFVTRKMVKFYAERFSTMKMDKEVIDKLIEASNDFWIQNLKAAEGYALHAGRNTITEADIVLLMKVQRMCNSTAELHDLIREYLPMELRCDLIPTAQVCVSSKSTK